MRLFHFHKYVVLWTCFFVLMGRVCTLASGNEPATPDQETRGADQRAAVMLSVEQTVALCYTIPRNNLLSVSNPEAREYVERIASKSGVKKTAGYAWFVLGYIGNAEDADQCESVLLAELSKAEPEGFLVQCTYWSLSRFAERGLGKAQDHLEQMSVIEYWKGDRFALFRKASGASRRFEEFTVARAVDALAAAGIPSTESLATKAKREYPTDELKEWARWRLDPKTLKGRRDALVTASRIEITDEDRQYLDRVYRSIDQSEIARLELPKPEPATVPTQIAVRQPAPRELTAAEKEKLASEASEAYGKLTEQIRKGEFEQVAARALDNGDFVDPKRIAATRDEWLAALKEEATILRDVDKVMPKPGEQAIAVETVRGKEKESEIVTVTWKLPGTEAIGTRLFKTASDRHTVEVKTGTLIVLMKKRGGVWYWNPFGF